MAAGDGQADAVAQAAFCFHPNVDATRSDWSCFRNNASKVGGGRIKQQCNCGAGIVYGDAYCAWQYGGRSVLAVVLVRYVLIGWGGGSSLFSSMVGIRYCWADSGLGLLLSTFIVFSPRGCVPKRLPRPPLFFSSPPHRPSILC